MKITISRLLDVSSMDADIQSKITPLVAQVNQATEQFARALRGELTLQDNIKCVTKSLTAVPHDTATTINLETNSEIEGVVLLQSSRMTTGFYWELGSQKGSINITIKTDSSLAANLKLLAFLK